MTDPVFTALLVVWGGIMAIGGVWATYAGHTASDASEGGLGGYLLGGLMLVFGLIVLAIAIVSV